MIGSLILTAALASSASGQPAAPAVDVEFTAPAIHVAGSPFQVSVSFTTDGPVEAWRFNEAAFEIDGKPLGERGDVTISMPTGSSIDVSFDIGAHVPADGSFQLGCAGSEAKVDVTIYKAVERGSLKFLDMSPEDLAKYRVLFVTNQGPILMEMWPHIAPNHVRNFCDLADTGWYEGIQFHRVSPSFMIQGGCPNTKDKPRHTWGTGNGPRTIPAEFSTEVKHLPGVLSAARSNDPDSASSQFFIMTQANAGLDGKYSAFGKVLSGMDAVMTIARADGERGRDGTVKPTSPQVIQRSYVLLP